MRQADVKVGESYLTRISDGLARVRVIARTQDAKGRTVFRVERPHGRQLTRGATALLIICRDGGRYRVLSPASKQPRRAR